MLSDNIVFMAEHFYDCSTTLLTECRTTLFTGCRTTLFTRVWQLSTSCERFKRAPGASSEVMPTKITKITPNLYIPKSYLHLLTFTVECQADSALEAGKLIGAWVLNPTW